MSRDSSVSARYLSLGLKKTVCDVGKCSKCKVREKKPTTCTFDFLLLCCSLPRGDPVSPETHQLHVGHLKEPQPPRGGALQRRGGPYRCGHPHRAHDQLPGAQWGGCDGARFRFLLLSCCFISPFPSPPQPVEVPTMLSELRQQRMLMVQTISQYKFVYQVLIQFLKNSRLIWDRAPDNPLSEFRQMIRIVVLFFNTTDHANWQRWGFLLV